MSDELRLCPLCQGPCADYPNDMGPLVACVAFPTCPYLIAKKAHAVLPRVFECAAGRWVGVDPLPNAPMMLMIGELLEPDMEPGDGEDVTCAMTGSEFYAARKVEAIDPYLPVFRLHAYALVNLPKHG